MSGPDYTVTTVAGLKETLDATSDRASHRLLTNSPEYDSRIILEKLGLKTAFDTVTCLAHKPAKSREHFSRASAELGDATRVISIGDNFENEIAPALAVGCRAIYIDRLDILRKTYPGLIRAASTREAVTALAHLLD